MQIIDTDDKITCRICGVMLKRIAGKHLENKHNLSLNEYEELYPNAPTASKNYIKSSTKNSGLYMQKENYRLLAKEKFIGDKNPNHINNTTIEERNSRSPFSKNFIKYTNDSDADIFNKEIYNNRLSNNQKEYWIEKGFTELEAIKYDINLLKYASYHLKSNKDDMMNIIKVYPNALKFAYCEL